MPHTVIELFGRNEADFDGGFLETTIPHRTGQDPIAGGTGRSHEGKIAVIGAVEIVGNNPGRIRFAPIADFSADSIHALCSDN